MHQREERDSIDIRTGILLSLHVRTGLNEHQLSHDRVVAVEGNKQFHMIHKGKRPDLFHACSHILVVAALPESHAV